jgi:hypothetical protein
LLSSIIGRYVTKRRDLVMALSCSETYFHKDIKDEEKERVRHEARLHPLHAVLRAKPATTLTPRTTATTRGGRRLSGYSDDSPLVEVRDEGQS